MANIVPGSPIALEGMPPKDGLLAGIALIAQLGKNPPTKQETLVRFLGWEDPLEKG